MINRRDLLKSVLVALASGPAAWSEGAPETGRGGLSQGDEGMDQRIARIIAEYSAQGDHRTGTRVDELSADWLMQQITEIGVVPDERTLTFQRLRIRRAEFHFADHRIEGVPLYDCRYTDLEGVSGRLGHLDSDAQIGVIAAPPYAASPAGQLLERARRERRHRAIVVVTDPRLPGDGTATLNAEGYDDPYGPPVLQVPNDHWEAIRTAADQHAEARAIVCCDYERSAARNVGARLAGARSDLAPLVIMTPRSGWWNCASERGGGIACWLEMLRALHRVGPERDVWFTANTGHELGHIGLEHFLHDHADLVQGALLWVHLGANFAARVNGQVRLQYSDPKARETLAPLLAAEGVGAEVETPMGERPLGEARNIHDGGGRYISILGGNGLFHHPADRWPDAVDLERAAAWCRVMARLAVGLAGAA